MEATIIRVEKNIDKYNASMIIAQTDNGERKYRVFPGRDADAKALFAKVNNLNGGERVNLKLVKNGEYWNLADVEEGPAAAPGNTGGATAGGRTWTPNPEKDKEIRRAVSLKAAIEIVAGTLTSKSDVQAAARTAVLLAPTFEPYLETGDVADQVADAFDTPQEG